MQHLRRRRIRAPNPWHHCRVPAGCSQPARFQAADRHRLHRRTATTRADRPAAVVGLPDRNPGFASPCRLQKSAEHENTDASEVGIGLSVRSECCSAPLTVPGRSTIPQRSDWPSTGRDLPGEIDNIVYIYKYKIKPLELSRQGPARRTQGPPETLSSTCSAAL